MNKLDKSYDGIAKSFDDLEKRVDRCLYALVFLNGLVFGALMMQMVEKLL